MNSNLIKCPVCGQEFELTQAITNNIESKLKEKLENGFRAKYNLDEEKIRARINSDLESKYSVELKDLKNQISEKEAALKKLDAKELDLRKRERTLADKEIDLQKKFEEIIEAERVSIEKKAKEKALKDNSVQMEDMKSQLNELAEKLTIAQKKELDLLKRQREIEQAKKEFELEKERQLFEEKDRLYRDAKEKSDTENLMKIREKEELIKSMQRTIEELKNKSEKGSQQLQGEVQELELEEFLASTFPFDTIEPVAKGKRGADIIQTVVSNLGQVCGTIIWESKRTKSWSDSWIGKLKDDQREARADIAVIVSQALPDNINMIGQKDKVMITSFEAALGIAGILREQLIEINQAKISETGKNQKMEAVYEYLCSNSFKQRIEAIVEAFKAMKDDLDSERRSMEKQWAKREKQISTVIKNTSGMYGDLQAFIGGSLPEVSYLELPGKENKVLEIKKPEEVNEDFSF